MTEAEYRKHPAVSRSELWRISESPQKFKYRKEHPDEEAPSLLFGRAFHKMALEPDGFLDEYAIAPDVDRRTKEGKQKWQDFMDEAKTKTVLPEEMYLHAKEMCASLRSVPLAQKLLNGPKETPFFWVDDITGEACKCRTDCLNTQYSRPIIVDVKSTTDASTEAFMRDAVKFGYDFQSAMYSEGVSKHIQQTPLFVFIAVEKYPPYAVNILQADELFLRRGQNIFRELLGIYHECKVSGNWYGYLGKNSQINTLALPAWAAKDLL